MSAFPRPLAVLSEAQLEAHVGERLTATRAARDAFVALPAGTPFAEAARRYDRLREPMVNTGGWLSLIASVHPDEATRLKAEALEQELSALEVELSLDRALYERLAALDPGIAPGAEPARIVAHALRDFRRAGVDRDEATRARIQALQQELVEIGQTFDRNIVEGSRSIRIAEGHAGLVGLPDDFIAAHPEAEDGSVTITTDMPDFVPFQMYAERADLRRAMGAARESIAWPENGPVLASLLARRHELATLLGHASWADYATETEMVKSASNARAFLERVVERARAGAGGELEALAAEKGDGTPVHLTDLGFLTERVRRSRFEVDSQEVREYLPYGPVLEGLFDTIARLYAVEIVPARDVPVWHPSVDAYDLVEDGAPIGRFYLDMFPREGKFKHAAMFDMASGVAGEVLPEAALVCNFPEPSSDDPGLLLHEQVTTLFHEFGHLLHHLFAGGGDYLSFSGIACEEDFVEVPSQLFEEWAWDPAILQTFARHRRSGEPIPADLVRRMRAADEFGKALGALRQMVFATLSLTVHDRDPSGVDPMAEYERLHVALSPLERDFVGHFPAGFGHLNGYSARYYTYMWSLVIAKDLWGLFEAAPMDPEPARRYRASVLAPGGTRDAARLVEECLGREYSFDAFERWLAS